MTVLLRRTIRDHLRRARPEKILTVFQRIHLRFFRACGLASGRISFASSRTATSDRLPITITMRVILSHSILCSCCLALLMLVVPVGSGWCATVEVYYGPDDAPLDRLTTLYRHATRYLYVAVYGLTSPRAVEAMVAAKKRGVDVRLITDLKRTEDVKQLTALRTLSVAGIPILVNEHDGLMHLKQVVIDDEVNTTGSMNHTTSGNRYNDERLDVISDHAITVKAREKFLAMWNDHVRYREWK